MTRKERKSPPWKKSDKAGGGRADIGNFFRAVTGDGGGGKGGRPARKSGGAARKEARAGQSGPRTVEGNHVSRKQDTEVSGNPARPSGGAPDAGRTLLAEERNIHAAGRNPEDNRQQQAQTPSESGGLESPSRPAESQSHMGGLGEGNPILADTPEEVDFDSDISSANPEQVGAGHGSQAKKDVKVGTKNKRKDLNGQSPKEQDKRSPDPPQHKEDGRSNEGVGAKGGRKGPGQGCGLGTREKV